MTDEQERTAELSADACDLMHALLGSIKAAPVADTASVRLQARMVAELSGVIRFEVNKMAASRVDRLTVRECFFAFLDATDDLAGETRPHYRSLIERALNRSYGPEKVNPVT